MAKVRDFFCAKVADADPQVQHGELITGIIHAVIHTSNVPLYPSGDQQVIKIN